MMLGNRKAQHSFAQTPAVNMARSRFDRSFNVKSTMGFDYLYPIMVDEVIPGDTHNLKLNAFARLATQVVPVLDNIYMDYFFFFVPMRLVWSNWEKFCGAQDNPGDSTSYTIPTVSVANFTADIVGAGTTVVYRCMGLPPAAGTQVVNSLPFRAYNLIWNTWFRDENIQNSVTVPTDNGPDTQDDYQPLYRGKRKDYFTSALPWPQKGTAINLLPSAAVVTRTSNATFWDAYRQDSNTKEGASAISSSAAGAVYAVTGGAGLSFDPKGTLVVAADAAGTINQLRQAMQIQSMLELDARGGTRYVELLLAHFNVVSPDFRLQRPEYLGGGEIRVNTHAVPQTSSTSGSNYQGQLASFGTASTAGKDIGFTKSFTEHGYIIGLCAARADVTYQKGINKMFLRSTRYDFFWPKLQEIGEQSILGKEIYADGSGNDTSVFGYQERYAEYRYKPSEIQGYLNSHYGTTLDIWHMAEKFGSRPSLNTAFISSTTPTRMLANTGVGSYAIMHDMFFELISARPMMTYSIPASLGRF